MAISDLAGKPAPRSSVVNIPKLISSYYSDSPKGEVAFGTSGHRGSSFLGTFNDAHIAATAQAICEYRISVGISGPLFMGFDTHALSEPAFRTALEVLAANSVETIIHQGDEFTPTPVISFLILEHNKGRTARLADGVVVTPSHNPPADGGFKYNPPHGGPADIDITNWIETRANDLMRNGNINVKRLPYEKARRASNTHEQDFIKPFVDALPQVIDVAAIKRAGVRIGADPMGGAGINYWPVIASQYELAIEVVNPELDPTFRFMTLDSDGQIRMDCSSPFAMARLINMANHFDIAWGNDPDFDRHGIVCASGLMNPNHYLSVAIWYLLQNRPNWKANLGVGKTLVSSSMIDKVVHGLNRRLYEVPVGFKWFVDGLSNGSLAFGGEESAGASFLRMDATAWTTDKDGFSLALLSAEILAKTGKSPDQIYRELVSTYGEPYYKRVDGAITDDQKKTLKNLKPGTVGATSVAGLPITSIMTRSPGNNELIGGVKVQLKDGSWFAIRPSGTEPKMKVYVESFGGEELWDKIYAEALPAIFGN